MFGYIAPRMELLSEEQRRRYRLYYCGICRELGMISGRSGRLLLSHDMTFLAILLNSLMEPDEETMGYRCAVHPLHARDIIRSKAVSYAAAMNLILMDFKCQDQVLDNHSSISRLERNRLKPYVEKLKNQYPVQYSRVEHALLELWKEEKSGVPDPDRLSNFSGEMLGAVFVPDWADAWWASSLRGLGEGLGRFVYWMDAWEDRTADRKKGNFNPLEIRNEEDEEKQRSFVRDVLEMLIGEAASYFEMLPLEKDLDLLRNVLYSGVWQRYDMLQQRAEKERKRQ